MSQTVELNSADATRVYPLPSAVDEYARAELEEFVHSKKSPEGKVMRVKLSNEAKRTDLNRDYIGTITVTLAGGVLLGGVPFGLWGAVVGGVSGFIVGFYNERVKKN